MIHIKPYSLALHTVEKSHIVLDLIGKEYNKHFDYIIIICPTLRWNKTYHAKGWIKHDDNVWLTYRA